MLSLLVACNAADPDTLVDELRVLVIQPEPPELRIPEFPEFQESIESGGQPPQNPFPPEEDEGGKLDSAPLEPKINIVILDPLEEEVEIAVWVCTNFGDGCLEKELYPDAAQWIQYHALSGPEITVPTPFSPFWLSFLQEPIDEGSYFSASLVWVLACAPSVCELVHDLKDGVVDVDAFSDPFTIMETLPALSTSLAFRSLNVSSSVSDIRLQNPQITPLFEELTIIPGESQNIEFDVSLEQRNSEAIIYGYTTIGGFSSNDLANNAIKFDTGTTSLQWFTTEEESGEAQIISIIDDGLGGLNYWLGSGTVQK